MEVQEPGIRHAIDVEKHSRDPPPCFWCFLSLSHRCSSLHSVKLVCKGYELKFWLKLVGLDVIKSGSRGWGTGTPKPRSIAPLPSMQCYKGWQLRHGQFSLLKQSCELKQITQPAYSCHSGQSLGTVDSMLQTVGDSVPHCELMAIPNQHSMKRNGTITASVLAH